MGTLGYYPWKQNGTASVANRRDVLKRVQNTDMMVIWLFPLLETTNFLKQKDQYLVKGIRVATLTCWNLQRSCLEFKTKLVKISGLLLLKHPKSITSHYLAEFLHNLSVLFTTAKIWKQCKYPSRDERIRKYMYAGIELILEDKEILPFETVWKTLEYIMPSKINQAQKDNYSRILCVNYYNRQRQRHRAEPWAPEAGRWPDRACHTSELAVVL